MFGYGISISQEVLLESTGARHVHLCHWPTAHWDLSAFDQKQCSSSRGFLPVSCRSKTQRESEVKSSRRFEVQPPWLSTRSWKNRRECHQQMAWEKLRPRLLQREVDVSQAQGNMKSTEMQKLFVSFPLVVFHFTNGSSFTWGEWFDHFVKKIKVWGWKNFWVFRFGVSV